MVQCYQLKSHSTDLKGHYKTAYNLYITLYNEPINNNNNNNNNNNSNNNNNNNNHNSSNNNTAIVGSTHTQGSALQTSEMNSAYRSKHLMPCHWSIRTESYTIRNQTVFSSVEPSL
jgi:hypothetical protein